MEKDVSSLKIFNIVLCVIILITFVIVGTKITANAEEINISERNKSKMNKITLKIEGMMCPHCEARVKQTLEGVDGVKSADVSHKNGTAVVACADTVTKDTLTKLVEAQGYKVIG